jgi:hypothetical protein
MLMGVLLRCLLSVESDRPARPVDVGVAEPKEVLCEAREAESEERNPLDLCLSLCSTLGVTSN